MTKDMDSPVCQIRSASCPPHKPLYPPFGSTSAVSIVLSTECLQAPLLEELRHSFKFRWPAREVTPLRANIAAIDEQQRI